MKQMELSKGKFAIVDDEDYEWLSQWKWCLDGRGYAIRGQKIDGKHKVFFMHREIKKTPISMQTDHINGNKLDNRKSNLRMCTNKENQGNSVKRQNTSSAYKGVHWKTKDNKWVAKIVDNGKAVALGSFSNEVSAAIAYNEAARKIFGEFARLNII